MTLEELDQEIYQFYQNLTAEIKRVVGSAPVRNHVGAAAPEYTTVQIPEVGHIAQLWALWERKVAEEA